MFTRERNGRRYMVLGRSPRAFLVQTPVHPQVPPPGMRSRTGCLTCRQRKLKCDEKKPACGQCCKASRECVPSSGIVFRHQHNASINGGESGGEDTLKGFYAYKNTFNDETVWLDIPKNISFINTTNPYTDSLTPEFESISITSRDSAAPFEPHSVISWPKGTSTSSSFSPGLLDHPEAGAPSYFAPLEFDTLPCLDNVSVLHSSPNSAAGTPILPGDSTSNQQFRCLMNNSSVAPSPIDPRLASPFDTSHDHMPSSIPTARQTSAHTGVDHMTEQDYEIAFLLRWFSEGPGSWMDLFDLGAYFTLYIPVKAHDNALLRYAALAYSAKALARIQGRKPVIGGSFPHQACIELYPKARSVDWYHKATQYYDTAVSLLLQALKDESIITSEGESDCEMIHSPEGPAPKRRRTSNSTSAYKSNPDELLAASAILSIYEFLDVSVPEWAKHLNGAKSLLVIAQERMMPLQMLTPSSTGTSADFGFISKARRATFWNIARQDMLAAFINKTHTQLDTEDLALWKEAGLSINDQGSILPSNMTENACPKGEDMMKEDLICNALVWLMAKLVNFMAAGDDPEVDLGASWAGVNQRTLLDHWYHIKQQFQTWYDGLPVTFRPCARIESSRTQGENEALFPKVWYSMPMCASTMQSYHMSQIQLLMNKPHESTQGGTTVCARLNSYHSVLAACQVHSREVVGISLARPNDAVRVQSVQPLFTAGQCLSDSNERQVVLDLLRAIETDIGWATDYRGRQLVQQWQWEEN